MQSNKCEKITSGQHKRLNDSQEPQISVALKTKTSSSLILCVAGGQQWVSCNLSDALILGSKLEDMPSGETTACLSLLRAPAWTWSLSLLPTSFSQRYGQANVRRVGRWTPPQGGAASHVGPVGCMILPQGERIMGSSHYNLES